MNLKYFIKSCHLKRELKKKKIYVRYWDKDKINNYLRITVGTDGEMNTLIEALREILLKGRNL